jgi:hypothetical protein
MQRGSGIVKETYAARRLGIVAGEQQYEPEPSGGPG